MTRHIATILLHFIFILLPFASFAEPIVNTRSMYYMVGGNTAEEIWSDIKKKSPVKQHGRLHVAYTKWDAHWQFWWYENTDTCEITRVTTRLDVAYTMPRLERTATMPDSLLSQWDTFKSALLDHEHGHRDLGIKAANEIEITIAEMEPMATCNELERLANKAGKDIIKKYSRIEKDYDRSTNHGLNTGAVFPLHQSAGK